MSAVSKTIVVKADIKTAYDVICDFESYPDFLPDMTAVDVIKSGKTSSQVEFQLNLIKSIRYTLSFIMKAPTRITWKMLEGDMLKKNNGSWDLIALEDRLTELTYTVDVEFGMFVPSIISNALISKSLPSTLDAFKKRIEKLGKR